MTKKEFENYIDQCSNELWVCNEADRYCFGEYLCIILGNDELYAPLQLIEFKRLMTDSDIDGPMGIFGYENDFKNQAQRFMMLYLFEQYCIDSELYKQF